MKVAQGLRLSLALAALLVVPTFGWAAKPTSVAKQPAVPPADAVDLFVAMEAGDVEVKLIPKDATAGTVTIKNKTKKPLTIKLPDAFAGVPVQAQIGGGFGGGGIGGGGNNNQQQGMGGGFGGGMMGGGMGGFGGGGMGGGFFNVAPEKVGKLPIVGMCLEHGKKDPNPRVPYELRPIESFTKNPEVIELVKMLGRGEIDQRSAQAAAWHLANGMSWQELATKIGARHIGGATEPFFTRSQIEMAMKIAREAERRAEASGESTATPGKETSLSGK